MQSKESHNLHCEINQLLSPENAWDKLKRFCDEQIGKLGKSFRVSDDSGEGILIRLGRTLVPSDNWSYVTVDESKLGKEEGLSYALFNDRQHCCVDDYQIISYEAPLMRQAKRLPDVMTVKCDLVAYSLRAAELVAIEVKIDARQPNTSIQHGMLQAMAYGHILQHCLNQHLREVEQQIRGCLKAWCRGAEYGELQRVSYALAAPRKYFAESLYLHGTEWLARAIEIRDVPFAGFWLIDLDVADKRIDDSVVPTTRMAVKRIMNVDDLLEECGIAT